MNILITSAGRRVSIVRAFQKELKKVYPDGKIIATDSNTILSAACQVATGHFEVPKLDHPDYIDVLIAHCKEWKIKLIIPTIDTELFILAKNKSVFEENNIQVLISSEACVNKCRDKRLIHKFFESNNIRVAHEYSKENYELPLYIKPVDGSRSVDNYIIKTKENLRDYHFTNDKLMFLQYLDHAEFEEFTCDLYYGKDNLLKCVVPRKRIEVRDGEVYKALTVNNDLVPYIKERLHYINGAIGCLTAQFFRHKSKPLIYGIEINPRFGGGYPLSYCAGANFPKWIIEEYFLNKTLGDKFDCWESNLLMIRYDDEILVHGYQN